MSIQNMALTLLAAFIINSIFYIIPYLMPGINTVELLVYQVFANGIIILYILLPRNIWSVRSLIEK